MAKPLDKPMMARAMAAVRAVRNHDLDPLLALSLVIDPPPRLKSLGSVPIPRAKGQAADPSTTRKAA